MSDLARGFAYPFRGVRFLFENPSLRRLALLPAMIAAVGIAVVMVLALAYGDDLLARFWPRPDVWYMTALWYLAMVAVMGTLVLAGVAIVPPMAAAPFQESLAREAERLHAGKDGGRERPLWIGVAVAVADQFARTVVLLFGYALLMLLWLVPVVGSPISSVLAFLWTAVWAAADNLDVPMSRHRYRFRDFRALFARRSRLVMGFGAATALLLMIPVLNFIVAQSAVVAATLLFLSLREDGSLPPPESAS